MKEAGAEIGCILLDAPLYFGTVFDGKNACHFSIAEIAKDVAVKVKQVQSINPGVPFGDVEPIGIPDAHWLADLEQWFDANEAATGQRLTFFCIDMQ